VRHLRPADYTPMPWKNGQGTTTELCRADAAGHDFLWRTSIATVSADGPFSPFPGYDRHILCLDGEGFVLEGGPTGSLLVDPEGPAQAFSGDWAVACRLINGPVRDFNLIALRNRCVSRVSRLRIDGACSALAASDLAILHVAGGSLRAGPFDVLAGETLVLSREEPVAVTGRAQVILAQLRWRQAGSGDT
jgi:uncharacterized protein